MPELSLRRSPRLEYPRSVPVSLSVLVALPMGLLAKVDERLFEVQRILAGHSEATPAVATGPREAP